MVKTRDAAPKVNCLIPGLERTRLWGPWCWRGADRSGEERTRHCGSRKVALVSHWARAQGLEKAN